MKRSLRPLPLLLTLAILTAIPVRAASEDEDAEAALRRYEEHYWMWYDGTEKPTLRQHEDLYWYVEGNYAVIAGCIYDCLVLDNPAKWDGGTAMVIPAEIEGYPVKVFDGRWGGEGSWSPDELILPEGLTAIRSAFASKRITIPSTVTLIEDRAVGAYLEINVSPDNPNYKSIDGVLYTKDGKELIYCPINFQSGGTFIIPEGVEKVRSYAFFLQNFHGASHDTKILVFPEGLTTLEDRAIFEAYFSDIYFPSTLEYIGEEALGISGDDIYFAGEKPSALDEHAFTIRSGDIRLHYGVAYPAGEDSTPQEIVVVPMKAGASPSLTPFPPSTPTPTPTPIPTPTPKPTPAPTPTLTPDPSPAASEPPEDVRPGPSPSHGSTVLLLLGGGTLLFASGFLLGRKKPKKN